MVRIDDNSNQWTIISNKLNCSNVSIKGSILVNI